VARALPPVAIIPLVILWLGIGDVAKVSSIAFAVFFPVWINTYAGANRVPSVYLWSGRSFGFSKREELFKIVLPASVPFIEAGLRTGIALAFVMVFVSELAGANAGLGYTIAIAQLAYRVDRMLAALVTLALLAATADYALHETMLWALPWLRDTTRTQ
jgi:ABC-type nitrate/sulfonate/bicarbonate transport system permease component